MAFKINHKASAPVPVFPMIDPVPRSAACRGLTYGNTGSTYRISCQRYAQRLCIRILDHGNHRRLPLRLWPTDVRDTLSI